MLIILFSIAVLIVGLLMFVLSKNPKVEELGKIAYFVGLFWFVWHMANVNADLLRTLH